MTTLTLDEVATVDTVSAKKAFVAALCSARAAFTYVDKSGRNSHLKSEYAKLEDIQGAIDEALYGNGLIYDWTVAQLADNQLEVTCNLTHVDGYTRSSRFVVPYEEGGRGANAIQARAVAYTYGRRYTLMGVTGVRVGGEDTDGEPKNGRKPAQTTPARNQLPLIRQMLKQLDKTEDQFLRWAAGQPFGASSLDDIEAVHHSAIVRKLESWGATQ